MASNAERVDWLLVAGERLIQRSESRDAVLLEEELQDLVCYCQEVFRRVSCFLRRLVSTRLVRAGGARLPPCKALGHGCYTRHARGKHPEAKQGLAPVDSHPVSPPGARGSCV